MSTIVQRLDGTIYDLEKLDILTIDFLITSPYPVNETETTVGVDGVIDLGSSVGYRKIVCSFLMRAVDMFDFLLLRNEVFKIFNSREAFYLIDKSEPGKRWLVKTSSEYEINQRRLTGRFDVSFIAFKGFAESIGTSLDPFTFDSELWQIGQGLHTDVDIIYKHSSKSFSIFNAGDIEIDPRWLPLIINYKGASTNLKIKNTTTGNEWAYTGSSNTGDTIKLDGIRSTKNGLSITRATNKKVLILAPGWNNFTLTGTSGSFEIIFDFRFYYL